MLVAGELSIGDEVLVTNKNLPARVRYVGRTSFAKGVWIGVELTRAGDRGKNSGIVKGEKYFSCRHDKGLFLRLKNVKIPVAASATSSSLASTTPSVASSPTAAKVSESTTPGAAISPDGSVNNQLGLDIRRTRKSGQDARGEIARLMNKVESAAAAQLSSQEEEPASQAKPLPPPPPKDPSPPLPQDNAYESRSKRIARQDTLESAHSPQCCLLLALMR